MFCCYYFHDEVEGGSGQDCRPQRKRVTTQARGGKATYGRAVVVVAVVVAVVVVVVISMNKIVDQREEERQLMVELLVLL